MIKEEYDYNELSAYLISTNDLLIAGVPTEEDRSHYFSDKWKELEKDILLIREAENNTVVAFLYQNNAWCKYSLNICTQISDLLRDLNVQDKNILLDISSLSHVLIMVITKQLITKITPKSFFASYIRPQHYCNQTEDIGVSLSKQINAVESVPNFSKRESPDQTLCAFLGFEGMRLKNILETVHGVTNIIPIVAFPSSAPQWYNTTMWNSMDVLQSECENEAIYKCLSESVHSAVDLLNQILPLDKKVILAPLGTRPHSMACAIYASTHSNTQIIYDYAIEHPSRANGIANITIYHLSSFLKN